MNLGQRKFSFDHARFSHRSRGDRVSHHRAACTNARGYWAAIATLVVMQSTLGATLTLSIERIAATVVGASVGAPEANHFRVNLVAFAVAIFFIGLLFVRLSFGEDRISLRERYAYHHRSDSALRSAVGDCFA